MTTTLITRTGKIMVFHVASVATLYQTLYGGTIIDPTVLRVTQEIALL